MKSDLGKLDAVVIAVHGIGRQVRNETILAAARRVCGYHDFTELLPLGDFYGALNGELPAVVVSDPGAPDDLKKIGFGEVYWADIAREFEDDGFVLQETRAWAKTVISEMQAISERNRGHNGHRDNPVHYGQIEYVLDEMIDTISTVDSLLFLAKKAGVFSFDLNTLLNDYVGSVQLVAGFQPVRERILAQFDRIATAVRMRHGSGTKIILVSHSEGTVVSFLGLLTALAEPQKYPWIEQVSAFMTFGSPIDKHLVLWPKLFAPFEGLKPTGPKIEWYNYTDNGDPVGFELIEARLWLEAHGYQGIFNFPKEHDLYFTRYPVPGAAHTAYWTDAAVFNHFLAETTPGQVPIRPPNLFWSRISSYAICYAVPAVLVVAAVYCLSTGILHSFFNVPGKVGLNSVQDILRLSLLVAGLTFWLRIQQLVRALFWHLVGFLGFAVAAAIFGFVVHRYGAGHLIDWLNALPSLHDDVRTNSWFELPAAFLAIALIVLLLNSRILGKAFHRSEPGQKTAKSAASSPTKNGWRISPPLFRNTLRTMLLLFAVFLSADIIISILGKSASSSYLPALLGTASFLYLWRLAALIFDLAFIWHRYIRSTAMTDFLRHEVARPAYGAKPAP